MRAWVHTDESTIAAGQPTLSDILPPTPLGALDRVRLLGVEACLVGGSLLMLWVVLGGESIRPLTAMMVGVWIVLSAFLVRMTGWHPAATARLRPVFLDRPSVIDLMAWQSARWAPVLLAMLVHPVVALALCLDPLFNIAERVGRISLARQRMI